MYFYWTYDVISGFFFFSIPFFLVLSFLKEGMLASSEVLRAMPKVPNVVFIFYLISKLSYILFLVRGGNFVADFAEVSLSCVLMPFAEPERHPGLELVLRSRV